MQNSIIFKAYEDTFHMEDRERKFDVLIVGGLGHVGLPLGIVFAQKGLEVCLFDIDENKAKLVLNGIMPFVEHGAEPILKDVLEKKKLKISFDKRDISYARNVIITLGTEIDEYMNPQVRKFMDSISEISEYLDSGQTLIIRSTVYPGVCRQMLKNFGWNAGENPIHVAYCPERLAQGYGIKELLELPQIVSGFSEKAIKDAIELFSVVSPKIVETIVEEAELIKLFSNSFRYIQFSVANQFYTLATKLGLDYERIRKALIEGYDRAGTLASAGFSAGPCLLKDTMHLVAFDNANFPLGNAAMIINEGLPNTIVESLKKKHDLNKKKVGILGMAFKAEVDDIRDSLSFKLRKLLKFHGAEVFCSDEFAKDPRFVSKEELIKNSDIIIVGAPHSAYKELQISGDIDVVDLWGILKKDKNKDLQSEKKEHSIGEYKDEKYPYHRELGKPW